MGHRIGRTGLINATGKLLLEPVTTETVYQRSDKYTSEKGVNAYILRVTEVNILFATNRDK